MRSNRLVRLAIVAILVAASTPTCRAADPAGDAAAAADSQPAEQPRPLITVSKETTRILGPLREDGYVDYFAALNESGSRDVTPKNNCMVLIWKTLGPVDVDKELQPVYFRHLGVSSMSEKGGLRCLLLRLHS
jgi:hypothetical protein